MGLGFELKNFVGASSSRLFCICQKQTWTTRLSEKMHIKSIKNWNHLPQVAASRIAKDPTQLNHISSYQFGSPFQLSSPYVQRHQRPSMWRILQLAWPRLPSYGRGWGWFGKVWISYHDCLAAMWSGQGITLPNSYFQAIRCNPSNTQIQIIFRIYSRQEKTITNYIYFILKNKCR